MERATPRDRRILLALLAVTIVAGLSSRRFAEALPAFVADHAGDALWTMAVYLGFAFLRPSARALWIAVAALAFSFAIEFSQLLDWPWLVAARGDRLGRLVLGVGFLPIDLLRYTVGALLGWFVDRRVFPKAGRSSA